MDVTAKNKRSLGFFLWLGLAVGLLVSFATFLVRRRLGAILLGLTPPQNHVRRVTGVQVTMPDGVRLVADHYYPRIKAAAPAILIRSPYGRNERHTFYGALLAFCAFRFAERGYHVIVQDVRGRFDSEGTFVPYRNERGDGIATLDWLKRQPWFSGRVGTWGPSYLGMVQWAVADQPEVGAMVPIFTSPRLQEIVFPDNTLSYGLVMRWIAILYEMEQHRGFLASLLLPFRVNRMVSRTLTHLPIQTADELILGKHVHYYDEWLANDQPHAPLWSEIDNLVRWDDIQTPTHLISGWYDFFQRAQLADYRLLRERGVPTALTVGPWAHFNDFNGLLSGLREGVTWFDHHLKSGGIGSPRAPVRLYVMNAGEWQEFADYPPETRTRTYYLTAENQLTPDPVDADGCAEFTYDPHDPPPAIGGAQFDLDLRPVRDNRRLQRRPDVVTFTSPVLEQHMTLIGHVDLLLHVTFTTDVAHFYARLCDVYPDGRVLTICDGLQRVEGRPSTPVEIQVDLWSTAYQLRKGHALRLIVGGGAFPRWNRNPGVSRFVTSEEEMLVCTQAIYYSDTYLSRLELPVM